mgnify:FL=1
MKKKLTYFFVISTSILLIVLIGLLSYHLDYFVKYEIGGSDFLQMIFIFIFLLIAFILYCVILYCFINKRNVPTLIFLKFIILVFLLISFILTLIYTIDNYHYYLIEESLSWNDIFLNGELTTILLTILFASIFLFIAFVFVLIQIILDIKNKNYPQKNLDKLRQSRKDKRRKHLQDKIDKLDE